MLIHLFPSTPVSRTLPWLLQSKNEFNVHTIYHMSNRPIKITYFLGMQTLLSALWVSQVWTRCTFKLGQHFFSQITKGSCGHEFPECNIKPANLILQKFCSLKWLRITLSNERHSSCESTKRWQSENTHLIIYLPDSN